RAIGVAADISDFRLAEELALGAAGWSRDTLAGVFLHLQAAAVWADLFPLRPELPYFRGMALDLRQVWRPDPGVCWANPASGRQRVKPRKSLQRPRTGLI